MNGTTERYCAICLEPRVGDENWFLLTENRWTDRLKILAWNDNLADRAGVHAACGAEHVQQLVIHWMAMGTLDYPFARAHSERKRASRKDPEAVSAPDPDTKGVKLYGELAVHRESLERVLSESPQSLGSVLTALISALGGQQSRIPTEECEEPELVLV
jgi:hypothetical protein